MRKVILSFLCLFSLCLQGQEQESNVRVGAKAGLSLATFSRGFFYQQEDFTYLPSLYAGATLSVRTDRTLSGKLEPGIGSILRRPMPKTIPPLISPWAISFTFAYSNICTWMQG